MLTKPACPHIFYDNILKQSFLSVPVEAYVKKIIEARFGKIGPSNSIIVKADSVLGLLFKRFSTVPHIRKRYHQRLRPSQQQLLLRLPTNMSGVQFTDEGLADLSKYLHVFCRELYYAHMISASCTTIGQREAIRKFMELYNLNDDDFNEESYYVLWKRLKSEKFVA
jgi:hypothetical protein